MFKFSLVFVSLFSSFFFLYLPLSMKNIEYYSEGMCYYKEESNEIMYVNSCQRGYKCVSSDYGTYSIGICLEYRPIYQKYDEKCNVDGDCLGNLICPESTKKCGLPGKDKSPYIVIDPISKEKNYFCSDNLKAIIANNDADNKCEEKSSSEAENYCLYETKNIAPDYMKVCGEIVFDNNKIDKKSISSVDIGELEIKENLYVENEIACKTGIALHFYNDKGKIITTKGDTDDFKDVRLCVNVTGVTYDEDNKKCIYRYKIGDKESLYDADNTLSGKNIEDCQLIMLKQSLFKDYLDKYNKLKDKCSKGKYYEEPYTCRNDDLRKLWYYYNNPKDYFLYREYSEIVSYLTENNYPTSYEKMKEEKNSKGILFKINLYFISFILLLSF